MFLHPQEPTQFQSPRATDNKNTPIYSPKGTNLQRPATTSTAGVTESPLLANTGQTHAYYVQQPPNNTPSNIGPVSPKNLPQQYLNLSPISAGLPYSKIVHFKKEQQSVTKVTKSPAKYVSPHCASPPPSANLRQPEPRKRSTSDSRHKSPKAKRPGLFNIKAIKPNIKIDSYEPITSEEVPRFPHVQPAKPLNPQFNTAFNLELGQHQQQPAQQQQPPPPDVKTAKILPEISNNTANLVCYKDKKQAKFRDGTNNHKLYCSKCAVDQVDQGNHRLYIIQQSGSPPNNDDPLEKLNLEAIQLTLSLNKHLQKLPEEKAALKSGCENMTQAVKNYYAKIIGQILDNQKADLNKIADFENKVRQNWDTYHRQFTDSLQKLKLFRKSLNSDLEKCLTNSRELAKATAEQRYRLNQLGVCVLKWEAQRLHFPQIRKTQSASKLFSYEEIGLIQFPLRNQKRAMVEFSFETKNAKDRIAEDQVLEAKYVVSQAQLKSSSQASIEEDLHPQQSSVVQFRPKLTKIESQTVIQIAHSSSGKSDHLSQQSVHT